MEKNRYQNIYEDLNAWLNLSVEQIDVLLSSQFKRDVLIAHALHIQSLAIYFIYYDDNQYGFSYRDKFGQICEYDIKTLCLQEQEVITSNLKENHCLNIHDLSFKMNVFKLGTLDETLDKLCLYEPSGNQETMLCFINNLAKNIQLYQKLNTDMDTELKSAKKFKL